MNIRLTYVYEDVTGKCGKQISVVLEPDDDCPLPETWFDHCESGEFFAPEDVGLPTAYFDSLAESPDTCFHLHKLINVEMTEDERTHSCEASEMAERWSQHFSIGFVGRGMSYAILFYLYRDAGNWKTYGEIAFLNPKELTEAQIEGAIRKTLDSGEFFVAESLGLPTLYHDSYDPNHKDEAHGYHEFYVLGVLRELPEGVALDKRPIQDIIKAFAAESEKGWPIARDLDAEFGDDDKIASKLDNLIDIHVGEKPSENFATTPIFWDCECQEHYIHPSSEAECYACMAKRDESPDSRVNEIQRYSDELPFELVALVNAAVESIDIESASIPF